MAPPRSKLRRKPSLVSARPWERAHERRSSTPSETGGRRGGVSLRRGLGGARAARLAAVAARSRRRARQAARPHLQLPEGGFAVEPSACTRSSASRGAQRRPHAARRRRRDRRDRALRKTARRRGDQAQRRLRARRGARAPRPTRKCWRRWCGWCAKPAPREVRVADNPIESPESCFVRSGIQQAAVEAGARVYLPAAGDFETLNVPGATWIESWPFFWRPVPRRRPRSSASRRSRTTTCAAPR